MWGRIKAAGGRHPETGELSPPQARGDKSGQGLETALVLGEGLPCSTGVGATARNTVGVWGGEGQTPRLLSPLALLPPHGQARPAARGQGSQVAVALEGSLWA